MGRDLRGMLCVIRMGCVCVLGVLYFIVVLRR